MPLYFGCYLDVSGCERLHGSAEELLARLASHCARLSVNVRLALSSTLGCAWALSRYSSQRIAVSKNLRQALAPLPLLALRLEANLACELAELGLSQIEDLYSLPPAALTERFPPYLLKHLQQALGLEEETFSTLKEAPPQHYKLSFDSPLQSLTALYHAIRHLLEQLLSRLEQEGEKIRMLRLTFSRLDAAPLSLSLQLNASHTKAESLWPLLQPRIERLQLANGIESVSLTIENTESLFPYHTLLSRKPDSPQLSSQNIEKLLDALASRLQDERIFCLKEQNSHLPERAFVYTSLLQKKQQAPTDLSFASTKVELERPSLLFASPWAIKAVSLLPDNPPSIIYCAGKAYRIIRGIGPERLSPEWWQNEQLAPAATRDYFKIQLQSGTWLWVFREVETEHWYVHGIWS